MQLLKGGTSNQQVAIEDSFIGNYDWQELEWNSLFMNYRTQKSLPNRFVHFEQVCLFGLFCSVEKDDKLGLICTHVFYKKWIPCVETFCPEAASSGNLN